MREWLRAGRGVWRGRHVCRNEGTATVCPGRAWRARQGGQTVLQKQAGALRLLGAAEQRRAGSTIPGARGLVAAWSLANVRTPSCRRGEGLAGCPG